MTKAFCPTLWLPLSLFLGWTCPSIQGAERTASVSYEDAERTAYYTFRDGVAERGEIRPVNPTSEQSRELSESLGHRVHECSNEGYRCVRTWFRVFAVPRKALVVGTVHVLEGAKVKIEECLRESEELCQVALLSADCELMLGVDGCEIYPRGRTESPRPGPITYFIYNEDYGVSAFGTAGQPATSPEQRRQVATQYMLQGSTGLLKE